MAEAGTLRPAGPFTIFGIKAIGLMWTLAAESFEEANSQEDQNGFLSHAQGN
jgi:hypothetical protein